MHFLVRIQTHAKVHWITVGLSLVLLCQVVSEVSSLYLKCFLIIPVIKCASALVRVTKGLEPLYLIKVLSHASDQKNALRKI